MQRQWQEALRNMEEKCIEFYEIHWFLIMGSYSKYMNAREWERVERSHPAKFHPFSFKCLKMI